MPLNDPRFLAWFLIALDIQPLSSAGASQVSPNLDFFFASTRTQVQAIMCPAFTQP